MEVQVFATFFSASRAVPLLTPNSVCNSCSFGSLSPGAGNPNSFDSMQEVLAQRFFSASASGHEETVTGPTPAGRFGSDSCRSKKG